MKADNMTKWVALLRGVNVGGVKVLMAPLREIVEGLGWTNVQTYIASGNLVFSAHGSELELSEQLRSALKTNIGVDTPIKVLSADKFQEVLTNHPWQPNKGNHSHVYFCWETPVIDEALYSELKSPQEELRVIDSHVHFHAPAGIGQSKLAERLGKVIQGTEITGRNLNTVRKLADMVCD